MSEGKRIPRAEAQVSINIMLGMLNRGLQSGEVLGSFRRNKPDIGDVDMIVLPKSRPIFFNHLDGLVEREVVKRGTNAGGSESWGEKKRLIVYRGLKFDIGIATPYNYGYQKWLRTGPGEANTILMSLLKSNTSSVRFDDGYGWHVSYHPNYIKTAAEKKLGYHKVARLNIPDEETFFMVLGMPFIEPEKRNEVAYRRYIGKYVPTPDQDILRALYVDSDEFANYELSQLANPPLQQTNLL